MQSDNILLVFLQHHYLEWNHYTSNLFGFAANFSVFLFIVVQWLMVLSAVMIHNLRYNLTEHINHCHINTVYQEQEYFSKFHCSTWQHSLYTSVLRTEEGKSHNVMDEIKSQILWPLDINKDMSPDCHN